MKTLFTVLSFSFAIGFANAQAVKEADVPVAVKNAMKKDHPNVKVEKWEKENGNYEAEFHADKVETCVIYDASGKHIATEVEIKVSELPQAVQDFVSKNFGGKTAKEAAKITAADGKISYEAEVDGVDYILDPAGNLIRKEEDKHHDD